MRYWVVVRDGENILPELAGVVEPESMGKIITKRYLDVIPGNWSGLQRRG